MTSVRPFDKGWARSAGVVAARKDGLRAAVFVPDSGGWSVPESDGCAEHFAEDDGAAELALVLQGGGKRTQFGLLPLALVMDVPIRFVGEFRLFGGLDFAEAFFEFPLSFKDGFDFIVDIVVEERGFRLFEWRWRQRGWQVFRRGRLRRDVAQRRRDGGLGKLPDGFARLFDDFPARLFLEFGQFLRLLACLQP